MAFTFPLIAKGSLFAVLQSIAMSGANAGVGMIFAGAAAGGSLSASMIKQLCTTVDSVDPQSSTSEKFLDLAVSLVYSSTDAAHRSQQTLQEAKEWMKIQNVKERFENCSKQIINTAKDWMEKQER